MRRSSAVILVIIALMLTVGAAGCGGASVANPTAKDGSPEAILAGAIAACGNMTGAAGSFDFSLSFDVDTSQVPTEALPFLGEPTLVSGTFAYADEPRAGEFAIALSMGGETMDIGMKLIESTFWISVLDQWYEAPPEMERMMDGSFGPGTDWGDLDRLLEELMIDPVTWFKDLRIVGLETVGGEPVHHLVGSPDVAKMMADVIGLFQHGELMGFSDPSGSMNGPMTPGALMPSADELQDMQTQLAQLFEDFTVDLWVSADDLLVRKAALSLRMVPPVGEDTGGLRAMTMNAMVGLDDVNGSVSVKPPASVLPFGALEKALQENPGLFMGPFMGLDGFGG